MKKSNKAIQNDSEENPPKRTVKALQSAEKGKELLITIDNTQDWAEESPDRLVALEY